MKPPAETPAHEVGGELTLSSGPRQDGNLRISAAPVTPVTPVTAEAFLAMRDFILEKDAHTLEDAGKRSIQRHLQKLTKGAQTSIARGILQQERIRFLLKTNDEAKVRRSTKSLVLGKAKVMSYEDLVEARAKRTERDAKKSARKQRRKRKGNQESPQDATFQPSFTAATILADDTLLTVPAQQTAAPTPPCPGAAPVARMY